MMILALIAAVAAQPSQPHGGAVVQATATVRIISGRRLTLGARTAEAELRRTSVRDVDGQPKPAQLIEFQ
jgi:hypothetical protein